MKTIGILEHNKPLRFEEVEEINLKLLQTSVDGYIAPVFLNDGITLIVDEEATLKDKPITMYLYVDDEEIAIRGTVVFVNFKKEDFTGLTKKQIEIVKDKLS